MDENVEAQNEEIEALQSIFGEECVSVIEESERVVIVRLAERSRLRVTLSKGYVVFESLSTLKHQRSNTGTQRRGLLKSF